MKNCQLLNFTLKVSWLKRNSSFRGHLNVFTGKMTSLELMLEWSIHQLSVVRGIVVWYLQLTFKIIIIVDYTCSLHGAIVSSRYMIDFTTIVDTQSARQSISWFVVHNAFCKWEQWYFCIYLHRCGNFNFYLCIGCGRKMEN